MGLLGEGELGLGGGLPCEGEWKGPCSARMGAKGGFLAVGGADSLTSKDLGMELVVQGYGRMPLL